MRLDARHFEQISTKSHNGSLLESYKAVHARSTMVLFSKQTHTPLAALTLKSTKDVGCLSMLTGRPSPENSTQPYFQGMLSMPDQAFTFVITNLSNKGAINFNILHTPHRVSEVDPGPSYGINEVNELHPNQSYEIEADQRTSRAMVLKGKIEKKFDPVTKKMKEVPVTVDESESTKDESKEGLYFYLSVVPDESSQTLVEKFKEGTIWKAAPGFVLRSQAPPARQFGAVPFGSPDLEFDRGATNLGRQAFGLSSGQAPTRASARRLYWGQRPVSQRSSSASRRAESGVVAGAWAGEYAPQSGRVSASAAFADMGAAGSVLQSPGSHAEPENLMSMTEDDGAFVVEYNDEQDLAFGGTIGQPQASEGAGDANGFVFGGTFADDAFEAPALQPPGPPIDEATRQRYEAELAMAAAMPLMHDEEAEEEEEDGSFLAGNEAFELQRAALATNVDVGSTQAGELTYGERINVHSGVTGHEYAYEHASEPTVLCMSIWEDMKFLPLLDTVEKMLEEEVKDWISNEGKAIIKSLTAVFKEDKCVIDLESEADTIVCTCGHQCINHANVNSDLRRCPICRSPVTAFVRADGIVV